jgi:hypothetical protein
MGYQNVRAHCVPKLGNGLAGSALVFVAPGTYLILVRGGGVSTEFPRVSPLRL